MTPPKFDPTRPHGEINPAWHGAQLQQGVNFFSAQGNFLFRQGDDPESRAARKTGPRAAAKPDPEPEQETEPEQDEHENLPADDDASDDELPGDDDDSDDDDQQPSGDDLEMDLQGWASNKTPLPFFQVKKYAATLLPENTDVSTKADIVKALVDAGVITPPEE